MWCRLEKKTVSSLNPMTPIWSKKENHRRLYPLIMIKCWGVVFLWTDRLNKKEEKKEKVHYLSWHRSCGGTKLANLTINVPLQCMSVTSREKEEQQKENGIKWFIIVWLLKCDRNDKNKRDGKSWSCFLMEVLRGS